MPEATGKDKNQQISNQAFIDKTDDLYNNQLHLNVNEETVKGVADMITNQSSTIMSNKERMAKADPIDLLAYVHKDVSSIMDGAIANDKKIATGRYTGCFSLPEELCSDKVLGQYYKDEQTKQQEQEKHESLIHNNQAQQDVPAKKQSPTASLANGDSGLEMF